MFRSKLKLCYCSKMYLYGCSFIVERQGVSLCSQAKLFFLNINHFCLRIFILYCPLGNPHQNCHHLDRAISCVKGFYSVCNIVSPEQATQTSLNNPYLKRKTCFIQVVNVEHVKTDEMVSNYRKLHFRLEIKTIL